VEARQNQLLLARIGVDVAHREHARDVGLEFLGVDGDLLAVQHQAPFGDRTELGRQAVEHQQRIERHAARQPSSEVTRISVSLPSASSKPDLPDHLLHPAFRTARASWRHWRGAPREPVAPVQQDHALGLADEVERPVERGVAAAAHHDVLAVEAGGSLTL
jgi:hypothetical protein